jgi:general secretion pathway protein A
MYKSFYKLTRNPFDITPDPYFFLPTPHHNEALATLYYGVRSRKGFVVVTGEVGTGKTLLLQCLLNFLNVNKVAFSYVFNALLTPEEFFCYVLRDLGLTQAYRNKSETLMALNEFLIRRHRQGLSTALVIDEAHLLSSELLEEIRLLTNLETAQQKLLQIVLVGQPELDRKLDSAHLRQLKQRITLRCRLEALTEKESTAYISRRLHLAGANSAASTIFPDAAVEVVFRYSRGIPRLINTICENALISGFARQASSITPEIIEEVAADFRLNVVPSPAAPEFTLTAERVARLERLLGAIEPVASPPRSQVWAVARKEKVSREPSF